MRRRDFVQLAVAGGSALAAASLLGCSSSATAGAGGGMDVPPTNGDADALLGRIALFPYAYVPAGWLPCDGRLLSFTTDDYLGNVLTFRFGGDGQSQFALPDLRGKEPGSGLAYCISRAGRYPVAWDQATVVALLGEVSLFACGFAPAGYLPCDGRALSIASNAALYSLLGARFGGDGVTTFTVPNLTAKSPAPSVDYFIATAGTYPSPG